MPMKNLVDSEGNDFKVTDVDGFYIPLFTHLKDQERDLKLRPGYAARDDDILLCNYPKSGTHWVWEIIQMLYNQEAKLVDFPKERMMLECLEQEQYDSFSSPRILNSHLYFSMLPKDFFRRKCKLIYTIRNPKDVAVSFYHHHKKILAYEYEGSWDSYFKRFLQGKVDYMSWFDNVRDWHKSMEGLKDYPIHIIHYEDLHLNYIGEIKRLAKFLNIKCDDQLARDIGDMCNIDVMRTEKCQGHEHWKENKSEMYRQGKVGGWKNVFTVAQNELFDKVYEEKMADLPIDIKFTI